MKTLAELRRTFSHAGEIAWIGVRPARDEPMEVLEEVVATVAEGLAGDRFAAKRSDVRAVTLVQAEHLSVIAALAGRHEVDPADLRRNLLVRGINLLALKGQPISVGDAVLELTGQCHPCSKMEKRLGTGAYNAMRGHGGMTARVIKSGTIRVGDWVEPLPETTGG